MNSQSGDPYAPTDCHVVQFYEKDDVLCATVADYIAEALRAGEGALLVVAAAHKDPILAALRTKGLDPAPVVVLDADPLLPVLLKEGAEVIRRGCESAIQSAARSRGGHVRAYAELVDLLMRAGEVEATLEVEDIWNYLARTYQLSVLCGHAIDNFYGDASGSALEEICRRHSGVNPLA